MGIRGGLSTRPQDLSFQLSYGVGGGVEGAVYTAINFFLMFYLTVIVGLSPSVAGSIMLVSLAIDALTDPIIGNLSDNSQSNHGRRHPFMIVSIVPLCISTGLLFSIPENISASLLVMYVLVINIVMRVFLGAYAIPYAALSAELWSDYTLRSKISVYRNFFFALATLGLIWIAFDLYFDGPDGVSNAEAYPGFGWTAAAIALFMGVFAWAGTRHRACRHAATEGAAKHFSLSRFTSDFVELGKNVSFRFMLFGLLAANTGTNMMFNVNLLTLNYFWNLPAEKIEWVTLAFPIGFFLGVPVARWITRYLEKRTNLISSILSLALVLSMVSLAGFSGFISLSSYYVSFVLITTMGLVGLMSMVFTVCFYAMVADVVDHHDLLFSTRKEGMIFSVVVLTIKIAAGLGAVMAGFGLDLIGFSNDLIKDGSIPDSVSKSLVLLWGLAPGVFYLICAMLFKKYHIDEKEHKNILEKLAIRESTAAKIN